MTDKIFKWKPFVPGRINAFFYPEGSCVGYLECCIVGDDIDWCWNQIEDICIDSIGLQEIVNKQKELLGERIL